MKDGKTITLIAVGGLMLWYFTRQAKAEPVVPPVPYYPPAPTGLAKTTVTEQPSIPLDVWRGLTSEQISTLPVTQQKGSVGYEDYYKTSQPVIIGDTGFKVWGLTESGAVVVSQRDPSTYAPWEWMH